LAKTLDEGFQLFLDSLLSNDSRPAVSEHREIIRECLDSEFGVYAFFLAGSFLSDTNIRGYGGVDYFVSIGEDSIPDDSNVLLDQVEQALAACFLGVVTRAPAVEVPFGAGESEVIRVVPARLAGQTGDGHRLYAVADGMGGWMSSSPDAHRAYVEDLDLNLDGKLRPLIRLLKAWKHFREVPISSFYLELRCVEYAFDEKMIVYTVDFPNVLQVMWDDQFSDVHDPKRISGYVPARLTYADRKVAISRLRTALYHTSRAQEAAAAGDVEEAYVYWNRVFNGRFPAYG